MKVKVRNMVSPRSGREVANQFIIDIGDNLSIFQSYRSVICHDLRGNNGHIMLDEIYWNYSSTTLKYLYQFLGKNKRDIMEGIKEGKIILTNLN